MSVIKEEYDHQQKALASKTDNAIKAWFDDVFDNLPAGHPLIKYQQSLWPNFYDGFRQNNFRVKGLPKSHHKFSMSEEELPYSVQLSLTGVVHEAKDGFRKLVFDDHLNIRVISQSAVIQKSTATGCRVWSTFNVDKDEIKGRIRRYFITDCRNAVNEMSVSEWGTINRILDNETEHPLLESIFDAMEKQDNLAVESFYAHLNQDAVVPFKKAGIFNPVFYNWLNGIHPNVQFFDNSKEVEPDPHLAKVRQDFVNTYPPFGQVIACILGEDGGFQTYYNVMTEERKGIKYSDISDIFKLSNIETKILPTSIEDPKLWRGFEQELYYFKDHMVAGTSDELGQYFMQICANVMTHQRQRELTPARMPKGLVL